MHILIFRKSTLRSMFPLSPTPHNQWHNSSHLLPPITIQFPQPYLVTRNMRAAQELGCEEYHFYYGLSPVIWSSPCQSYPHLYAHPAAVASLVPMASFPPRPPRLLSQVGAWPEGFTLRGELRWGRLERVYGPRKELPEFVREDLRRVYGTYPRTSLSITFRGGEYVVRGNPHIGEQEYKVERRVIRQEKSPEGDSMSEVVEKRKKRKKKMR